MLGSLSADIYLFLEANFLVARGKLEQNISGQISQHIFLHQIDVIVSIILQTIFPNTRRFKEILSSFNCAAFRAIAKLLDEL